MASKPEIRNRYPRDWKLRSFFVRVVRSRGLCEVCRAPDRRPHPRHGFTVRLVAAHVHDKRPEAAGLLNLAAMCQDCHLKHDRPERVAGHRRWLERLRRQ